MSAAPATTDGADPAFRATAADDDRRRDRPILTPGTGAPRDAWMFLGVRISQLSNPEAPPVVAEMTLPAGASPPFHVHDALDDSFYVLEGTMVVRAGDEVRMATPGTWVPFPAKVPHTFRLLDHPVRALLIHSNDSFMRAVRAIGHPERADEEPTTTSGPSPDELERMLAEHGIRTVGPPMEHEEAAEWTRRLQA